MSLETLLHDLLAGNRRALAQVITRLESTHPQHAPEAAWLLESLLPHAGGAVRLALSGPPGVGKSSFIEALGLEVLARGHRLAVLAIDPSSARTGGSLLGDKTRMPRLATDPRAFIRPSPAARTLGGTARRTLEGLIACEAAGFDVVIVETVGVGQSETAAQQMTDTFALLALPFAGDELQGLKRGIVELADLIVVNKADLDPARVARTQAELESALKLLTPPDALWTPRVLSASAKSGAGIPEFWDAVLEHRRALGGALEAKRREQQAAWFERLLREAVWERFALEHGSALEHALERVRRGEVAPGQAVAEVLGRERGSVGLQSVAKQAWERGSGSVQVGTESDV